MRLALWNWHTPYTAMLAKAIAPEWGVVALPTVYAPTGWIDAHRPKPESVRLETTWAEADVVLAQTANDLADLLIAPDDLPICYLAHNHAEMDGTPPERIQKMCRRLVAISPMKRESWAAAGYDGPIDVLPPGVDPDEYADGKWTGQGGYVLTVVNGLRRPLFDYRGWIRATEMLPADQIRDVRLVGRGNEGIRGAVGPAPSWDALKAEYRGCGYYLNPTCPPFEDTYNLAALEAAACGAPVRNLYGAPPRVEDFPIEAFRSNWRRVLEGVSNGQH